MSAPALPPRAFAVLAVLAAGGGAAPQADPWALYRSFLEARRVEVVLAPGPLDGGVRRALAAMEESSRFRGVILPPGDDGSPEALRVVIGTLDEPATAALAAVVGVRPLAGAAGFRLLGRAYTDPADALVATFEDPSRPQKPLTLYLGNDAAELAGYVSDLTPVWRPGLRAWRNGELALEGPLEADGSIRPLELRDFLLRRRERPVSASPLRTGDLVVWMEAPDEPERVRAYVATLERVRSEVMGWIDPPQPPPLLRVDLHFHPQDYFHLTGKSALSAHNRVKGNVHALLVPGLPDDGGAAAARATAIHLLGPPSSRWLLDGAGAHAAGTYWGHPLGSWVARLHAAGLALEASALVDPDAQRRFSPHRLVPLRGFLFGHLLAELGTEGLGALWRGERSPSLDAALEEGFRAALDANLARHGERLEGERAARRAALGGGSFRRGVALVPGGGDPEGALLSRALRTSLEGAAEHGADAVSIVFLAFAEPRPAAFAGEMRHNPDAAVSDVAVGNAVSAGRACGMRAMLAPELVATPSGTWAGDVAVLREGEQERFLADYRRFLVHYALLGELLGCEILCIGSELRLARTAPRGEEGSFAAGLRARRREAWRELIADVRAVFSGGLTYAARSMPELEEVEFWDRLDFVGVNLFPRVAGLGSAPQDEAASSGIRWPLVQRIEAAAGLGRPLLVVQTGFPSARSGAWAPWLPGGEVDLGVQRRLYELLGEAVGDLRDQHPQFAGIYLWSWDPDPLAGGLGDAGHTPQNKPAEDVLEVLFGGG